jgi:two-component system, OmpR family, sensor kinase
MKRAPSIALRLALGLTAGMALLWIGAAAISVGVMQQRLDEARDEGLRQSALRLLPLALHDLRERRGTVGRLSGAFDDDDGDEDDDDRNIPEGDGRHDPVFTYVIRNDAGEVVLRDEDAPVERINDLPEEGFADLEGRRTFALVDPRSGYSIAIVETTDRRMTALRDNIVALGLPLLALLPMMAGGIWLALRLALRPLERLRQDIAQRDSRNLEPVGSDGHPAELAPIAEAVGALLTRLKSALDAERAFAARSAHELRTPIAGALAQTQQLAAELGTGPGAARLREIEAALKKLSKLSEKLLQLARVEAGFARSDTATDLLPALDMVGRDINATSQWRDRVRLENGGVRKLMAAIDPDAFAIAVRNLLENGLKHGAADKPVRIVLGGDATLRVINEGGVVSAADLARLGQPFARGDTAADGSGLGLSIARTILEQAGGSLTLHSPATGAADGFEAIVELPAEPRR